MCWRKTSHQVGPANHEFLQESPPLSSFSDQSSPLPFTVQQLQGDFISTFFLISLRWQVLHAIQRFASWKGQNNGAGCCFGQLVHSQDFIPTPGIPALISERHHWMKLPCLLLGPQGTAAPLPIWNGLFLPHTIKREHFFFDVATFPAESWKWWTLATLTKGVIGCWSFSDFLKFKLIFINIVRPKKGSRNLEAKMCAKHCKYKHLCRKLFGGRHLYIVFRHCKRIDHQAPVTHVAFENIWLLQHTWWKSKV